MRGRHLLAVACVALVGCATSARGVQPRDGRSGLQGTGTLEGRQVAVGQGLPDLVVGDCDPIVDTDADVCFVSDTIDGRSFVLTFENPAVLVTGAELAVGGADCASPAACDAVTDVAVVSLKLGTDDPVRADRGRLTMSRVEPFGNYVGDVILELPDGGFTASFDVVPVPE